MISSQRTTALKATQENMAILPTCSKNIHNFDSYSVLYHDQSSQLSFASVISLGVIHFPSMSITSTPELSSARTVWRPGVASEMRGERRSSPRLCWVVVVTKLIWRHRLVLFSCFFPRCKAVCETASKLAKSSLVRGVSFVFGFLHFPWKTIGDSQKTIPLESWLCSIH